MGKKNKKQLTTCSDVILENLKMPDSPEQNGSLVESTPENGSFKAINTPINGIEADVDEL